MTVVPIDTAEDALNQSKQADIEYEKIGFMIDQHKAGMRLRECNDKLFALDRSGMSEFETDVIEAQIRRRIRDDEAEETRLHTERERLHIVRKLLRKEAVRLIAASTEQPT